MENKTNNKGEILVIGSYPPRACGIATYTQDLINAIRKKYGHSLSLEVCAIEEDDNTQNYPAEVKYWLKPSDVLSYIELAEAINNDPTIKKVFLQHEFGLFGGEYGEFLLHLLYTLNKPVSVTFHTVLPKPDHRRKRIVSEIAKTSEKVVVMTSHARELLKNEYGISADKISVIPHGTHIVAWKDKQFTKDESEPNSRFILSTFGLLSSNKSIEMALDALPKIVKKFPNVLYLVLGETHPQVVKNEGEVYRDFLREKVANLGLENHVQFINAYLTLPELLEYLRLTDIYLFTSKNPLQAVSGTFAYAMSCGCPVISTPIPHAQEMLKDNYAGVIVDFMDSNKMAEEVIRLLGDDMLRNEMSKNAFQQTRNAVWENTAIAHVKIFEKYLDNAVPLKLAIPEISLKHIYELTNEVGMIQFSEICKPDIESGYTLDDNARALIAISKHFALSKNSAELELISIYLNFIEFCQTSNGNFTNYVDKDRGFHIQNRYTNLQDSNGRAIWALGVIISQEAILPSHIIEQAKLIFDKALPQILLIDSPRAMAFIIKGMYFYSKNIKNDRIIHWIEVFADKLLDKYNAVSDANWKWFEEYLTYANSTLPEAMLYAYLSTNNPTYKLIAHLSFEFLLSHLFVADEIKVISNRGWHMKNTVSNKFGEQPIDVSYTIQTLHLFYEVFNDNNYRDKMEIAFSWFQGNNHLNQIMYNPVTGGCYDGLEEYNVNLNQGAESTVCYLMARLTMEEINDPIARERKRSLRKKGELVYSTLQPISTSLMGKAKAV